MICGGVCCALCGVFGLFLVDCRGFISMIGCWVVYFAVGAAGMLFGFAILLWVTV